MVVKQNNPGGKIPMANYQLPHLDLSIRLELAIQMLDPDRPWGQVTELADKYGVSRKFLYIQCEKAREAILAALVPQEPGRKAETQVIEVDDLFIWRAIGVCLSIVPGTVRTIRLLLELLFNVRRSTGYICQTAQALGGQAREYAQGLSLPLQALAEADEIFQGRHPCLTLVDGRSFLVLSLSAQEHRDATTWGCVFLDVKKQGVQLLDVSSDGALGIRAGAEAAQLAIPLRPDLFHLIREGYHVSRRLEGDAIRAMEIAERARRAKQEQETCKRRQGRPLKITVELPEAEKQEQQALQALDAWDWLFGGIRQALEPYDPEGRLTVPDQAQQTISVALDLLDTLQHKHIQPFTQQLREKLPELLAPLHWLEQNLAPWRVGLDPHTEAFIVWAWQHHKALGVTADQILPPEQQTVVEAFWEILAMFHRSSSLAESLHSWLRPYLQVHRGMPAWLPPLLQLVWNHHKFERGKRKDNSPMALAGVADVPTLSQLFDRLLGCGQTTPISV